MLEVDARRLVVISGQVAVDMDGAVVGETIEEQTRATLDNCADQLASAGCTLGDVFKVNIYLADLAHWARFNAVYETLMRRAAAGAHRRAGGAAAGLSGRDRDVGRQGEGVKTLASVELRNIAKTFGKVEAVRDVSLSIERPRAGGLSSARRAAASPPCCA